MDNNKKTIRYCEFDGKPLTQEEIELGMHCCQECENFWNEIR